MRNKNAKRMEAKIASMRRENERSIKQMLQGMYA